MEETVNGQRCLSELIMAGSILPLTDNTYDFGSAALSWKNIYFDTAVYGGTVAGDWSPDSAGDHSLGSATAEWFKLFLGDDAGVFVGLDQDSVFYHKTATLNANTALTGVLIGTPVTPALAANSMIIANVTADGDILIVGNDGGHSRTALFFDASTPDTYLYNVGGTWTAGATTWVIPAHSINGNLTLTAALDIVTAATTAAALEITDATNKLLAFDTRTAVDNITSVSFSAAPVTIANVAGTTYSQFGIAVKTLTLSGVTGVTALDGLQAYFSAPTINQSGGAVTVTTASTVYIAAPVAGASVTITNPYSLNLAGKLLTSGITSNTSTFYILPLNADGSSIVFQVRRSGIDLFDIMSIASPANTILIGRDDVWSSTNAVTDYLTLRAGAGTNNEAAGQGVGISWKIGNASSEVEKRAFINLVLTDATNASEDVEMNFGLQIAGAASAEILSIVGGGLDLTSTKVLSVAGVQVVGARVVDERADDTVDATYGAEEAGVLDALRDAMVAHGLIAAA